jgi:hypothetical protein
VELERLCFDANEIESGVEVGNNDAFVCEVMNNNVHLGLYRELPGWSPPYAPNDWSPTVNTKKEASL